MAEDAPYLLVIVGPPCGPWKLARKDKIPTDPGFTTAREEGVRLLRIARNEDPWQYARLCDGGACTTFKKRLSEIDFGKIYRFQTGLTEDDFDCCYFDPDEVAPKEYCGPSTDELDTFDTCEECLGGCCDILTIFVAGLAGGNAAANGNFTLAGDTPTSQACGDDETAIDGSYTCDGTDIDITLATDDSGCWSIDYTHHPSGFHGVFRPTGGCSTDSPTDCHQACPDVVGTYTDPVSGATATVGCGDTGCGSGGETTCPPGLPGTLTITGTAEQRPLGGGAIFDTCTFTVHVEISAEDCHWDAVDTDCGFMSVLFIDGHNSDCGGSWSLKLTSAGDYSMIRCGTTPMGEYSTGGDAPWVDSNAGFEVRYTNVVVS